MNRQIRAADMGKNFFIAGMGNRSVPKRDSGIWSICVEENWKKMEKATVF